MASGDATVTTFLGRERVPIMTSAPNDICGARGGEPLMLHPTHRGFLCEVHPPAPLVPGCTTRSRDDPLASPTEVAAVDIASIVDVEQKTPSRVGAIARIEGRRRHRKIVIGCSSKSGN